MLQVSAVLASNVAEIAYDDFSNFVEGLGSRQAKKISKSLASTVLDRFVQNEQRADYEDRERCAQANLIALKNHVWFIGS